MLAKVDMKSAMKEGAAEADEDEDAEEYEEEGASDFAMPNPADAVADTHLTLPTILLVYTASVADSVLKPADVTDRVSLYCRIFTAPLRVPTISAPQLYRL